MTKPLCHGLVRGEAFTRASGIKHLTMKHGTLAALLVGVVTVGAFGACNHRRSGAWDQGALSAGGKSTGSASVDFVDPADPEGPRSVGAVKITKSMTGFVKPQPIEPLLLPAYPASALAAHIGAARIAVRIDIAKDGHVVGVRPSVREYSTPTAFDAQFNEAIRAAVLKWEFNPGWTVPMEPGPNGSPVLGEPEAAESSLDAIFTFTSAGTVVTGVRQ